MALTPPGAITHTHMDHYGREQYFAHLFGEKIWLLWPPSAKNLEIFGKYHMQSTPEDLTS
jgi:glyoxylase-like metal-dependent hydrolase (beta-lactamase superfamily II)